MTKNNAITPAVVQHLAKLANLPISGDRRKVLIEQLATTFTYIDTLQQTKTDNLPETNQVTGLHNVWREDVVDETRTLTQEQALQNTQHSHNGFFVIPAIFVAEDN